MNLTKHARIRQQQRGVPPIVIDLLLNYSAVARAGKGATTHYFDKASRRRVMAYAGPLARQFEEYMDYYAVTGDNGQVITVATRPKKITH